MIEIKPCIMDYRPLIVVPITQDAVLGYSCGCLANWTGAEWKPEHEYSSIICVEPSHKVCNDN